MVSLLFGQVFHGELHDHIHQTPVEALKGLSYQLSNTRGTGATVRAVWQPPAHLLVTQHSQGRIMKHQRLWEIYPKPSHFPPRLIITSCCSILRLGTCKL